MVHRGRSLELLAGSSFLERHSLCEVRRMPGPVTEPIHVRHRPLTLLADNANARKPLGEVEDSPSACTTRRGASFASYDLLRSWLCPGPSRLVELVERVGGV